jgi:hypothetical protein
MAVKRRLVVKTDMVKIYTNFISVDELKAVLADRSRAGPQYGWSLYLLGEMDDFTPKDLGGLIESARFHSDFGGGFIRWVQEYAQRMFYGLDFNFQGAPMRGAFWTDRAQAANGSVWAEKLGGTYKDILTGKYS